MIKYELYKLFCKRNRGEIMEESNNIKIHLSTIFLIISLIIIIIMGFFIYKLYNDKQTADTKLMNLNNQVSKLEHEIDALKSTSDKDKGKTETTSKTSITKDDDTSIDVNNYVFKLDSKNKYTITTDLRWKTMQNDGGSHSSIYYQIDLDNNIISKVQEDYHANLGGTHSQQKNVIYIKKIDTNIQSEVKSLLNEIITKEDINETHNYNFFTIKSLDAEKYIYNVNTIESINSLWEKIDELN